MSERATYKTSYNDKKHVGCYIGR